MPQELSDADVGLKPTKELSDSDIGLKPAKELSDADVGLSAPHSSARGMGNSFLRAGTTGTGEASKGLAALIGLMPAYGSESGYYPEPVIEAAERRAARSPAQIVKDIHNAPGYELGTALTEAAPEAHPVPKEEEGALGTRIAGMAGSFVPLVASGPMAPLTIGLQSAGQHISDDYESGIKAGMNEDQAAQIALDRALASGTLQAGIFSALPKPLRAVAEKYLVNKIGVNAAARFLAGRAAAAGEGATLGASSQAAENAVEGRPITQNTGEAAAGLAAMNVALPWLSKREPTEEQAKAVLTGGKGELTDADVGLAPPEKPAEAATVSGQPEPPKAPIDELIEKMPTNPGKKPGETILVEDNGNGDSSAADPLAAIRAELDAKSAETPAEPRAEVTRDLAAELEAAMRGNQVAESATPARDEARDEVSNDTGRQEAETSPPSNQAEAEIARPGAIGEDVLAPKGSEPVKEAGTESIAEKKARAMAALEEATKPKPVIEESRPPEFAEDLARQKMAEQGEPDLPGVATERPRGVLEQWADQKIDESRGRLSMGIDPVLLSAYGVKVAAIMARGVRTIAEVGSELIRELGEDLRSTVMPHLERIFIEGAKLRQEQISERRAEISAQERRDNTLPKELKRERSKLSSESTAIDRELARNPEHVADLFRKLDQIYKDMDIARAAGNGLHVRELRDEADYLMEGPLAMVPKHIQAGVYSGMVRRGEISIGRAPVGPSARNGEISHTPEEPGAAPVSPEHNGEPQTVAEPGATAEAPTPATAAETQPEPAKQYAQRRASQMPERLQTAWGYINKTWTWLKDVYSRADNRDLLSFTKDAADNKAHVYGKQTANVILHDLNRAFGAGSLKDLNVRNETREAALTMAIEAGAGLDGAAAARAGDPRGNLMLMREKILGSEFRTSSWGKRALAAIDLAETHLASLEPIARDYGRLTDAQRGAEVAAGYNTLFRQGGYVFHAQDVAESYGLEDASIGRPDQPQGAAAPFKHQRDFPTYAESIAHGLKPRSLSAVDLLQRRMTLGARLINYGLWVDGQRRIIDPRTQQPVVTDPEVRIRADGSTDVTPPKGYFLTDFGGQQIAVHNGYSGIFGALTYGSAMRQNAFAQAMMKTAAVSKQFTLLGDTFHMGRLAFWNGVSRLQAPTYRRGLNLLDNTPAELTKMADRGEIPRDWVENLQRDKRNLDLLVASGLNLGIVKDNLYQDIVHHTPVLGTFNNWLFEKYQRGAMTTVGLVELERYRRMYPNLPEEQIVRRVAKDVNVRFGSLGSQGLFKNKTFQDLSRLFLLAPQWNESLIRAELGAIKEAVMSPVDSFKSGRPAMGMLARGVGAAMIGQFIFNQLLNYGFRGKPTWENPEEDPGAKISAWIPDAAGGPGFFWNPMAIPAEITHLLWKLTDRNGGDFMKALEQFAVGRLNNFGRFGYTFFSGKDSLGTPARGGMARAKMMGEELLPAPISSSAIYRLGKQALTGQHEEKFAGQFQGQVMQSFGIKTDKAHDSEGRIWPLAKAFDQQKGIVPHPDYDPSPYLALRSALKLKNERDADQAMDDLLAKKTPKEVYKYFSSWINHPYTGRKALEAEFFRQLNPEQQQTYRDAKADRIPIGRQAIQILRSKVQTKPQLMAAEP